MPRLLDLFCGAGGCAVGYHRAGFDVVGVDHAAQPRYPFEFVCFDALTYLAGHGHEFDAIHASPPCQGYSQSRFTPGSAGREYPKLIAETESLLKAARALWGRPYVIENVEGAPLKGIILCGTMFGLPLRRHRLFSSSILLLAPSLDCQHRDGDLGVYAGKVTRLGTRGTAYVAGSGRTHYRPKLAKRRDGNAAMGIDWMNPDEISEAIPPAYTEFIGKQLITYLEASHA